MTDPGPDPQPAPDQQPGPDPQPDPAPGPEREPEGRAIVRAAWAGTALFLVAAVAALAAPTLEVAAVVVDLALFGGGAVIFLWAYGTAIGRSRQVEIGIGGLYFLQGTAPGSVRLRLLGALGAEVAGAFATAGLRPFSGLAFGVLVPLWALGLCGLWGARYGAFNPRTDGRRG
jgi:hypothetical protein